MGPCWLSIKNFQKCKVSKTWCKLEVEINNFKNICKLEEQKDPPTLRALSISMKTIFNHKNNCNEIVILSGIMHNNGTHLIII